jgi:predicted AlkP superfamily phosphohydrolase/phosphomutase
LRTVTLGLDGCSWNVLDPLLETGDLPNLQALRDRSSHGVLESTIPFFTGPAWASYATGSSPAAHGVYDFMMLREDGTLSVAAQADLRRRTYYEQLGDEGKRSVLINMPLDQGGCPGAVIVNSWLTDDESRRILPVRRRERYAQLLSSYRTFPANPGDVDELCAIERARFDLARELFLAETWDHFFILFSSTDWLGHSFTGSFLRGEPDARTAFLRLYRDIDQYVGWLLDHATDAAVAVLSDHGQCEELAVVRINAVLRDLGLAKVRRLELQNGEPFFANRRAKARLQVRVPKTLGKYRSNPIVRPGALLLKRALRQGLGIEVTRAAYRVDRATSSAFCPTDASFAVYTRDVTDGDVDRIRDALLSVRLPDGRQAIEDVWTTEDLYGRSSSRGPTLLFEPAHGVRPSATLKESVVSAAKASGTGCHQRDGILMLAGPNIRTGDLGRTAIYDLAPTLLWTMDAGIPSELDGRVLSEAFEDDFAAGRSYREVDDGWREGDDKGTAPSDEVARRLKALGYI